MKIGKETGNKGGARESSKSKKKRGGRGKPEDGCQDVNVPPSTEMLARSSAALLPPTVHTIAECSYLKQITALSFCYRIPGTPVAHRVGLILCRALQSCSIAMPLYVPYTDTMSTSWTNIPSPL